MSSKLEESDIATLKDGVKQLVIEGKKVTTEGTRGLHHISMLKISRGMLTRRDKAGAGQPTEDFEENMGPVARRRHQGSLR